MADDCPKCPPVGSPAWMATFADMMTLLMCFFVLLLSFATMDARKFKRLSDAMANAFGVQKQVEAVEIPMGTSVIAQHFSPAPPEPTPLNDVKQSTKQPTATIKPDDVDIEEVKKELAEERNKKIQDQADKIASKLKTEIEAGLVDVHSDEHHIIIRINEKGSFPSGSAVLKAGFEPVLTKIIASINETQGQIRVAGHTDNIPISTDWYRSNWELATTRAVTVSEFMLNSKNGIDANRLVVEGYADTRPLVDNDTPENRAKNRRVEIVLAQDVDGAPTGESDVNNTNDLPENILPGTVIPDEDIKPEQKNDSEFTGKPDTEETEQPVVPNNKQESSQVDKLLGNIINNAQ